MTELEFIAEIIGCGGHQHKFACRDTSVDDGHLIVSDNLGTIAAFAPGAWLSFRLWPNKPADGSEAG